LKNAPLLFRQELKGCIAFFPDADETYGSVKTWYPFMGDLPTFIYHHPGMDTSLLQQMSNSYSPLTGGLFVMTKAKQDAAAWSIMLS